MWGNPVSLDFVGTLFFSLTLSPPSTSTLFYAWLRTRTIFMGLCLSPSMKNSKKTMDTPNVSSGGWTWQLI
jgi:hypothetical protein